MDRRKFLKSVGTHTAVGGAVALGMVGGTRLIPSAKTIVEDASLPKVDWQMATSWPAALDTIFGGAQTVADTVSAMTGGKFTIKAHAAGKLAPGLEVLDVVQDGTVPIGHTASYYYVDKSPVTAFGTALPFGLTARQQNAWLTEGGGLEMLQEVYAERFGVIQFPAGNTGVQMGGWFNKEINSVADMSGLKMRIPGLGAQVMTRLGVDVQTIPGDEIFQALRSGAIDAAEWVGPYDDRKLGLYRAASFYYYPGWWEPGPSLEIQINKAEYDALPEEYQAVLLWAAAHANQTMTARYDAKNPAALATLQGARNVTLAPFPDSVMQAAEESAFELIDEFAASDSDFASVLKEWSAFRNSIRQWHGLAEQAYLTYDANPGNQRRWVVDGEWWVVDGEWWSVFD